MQNLIAYWALKFMVDAFDDFVHKPGQPKAIIGNASVHTLTYKDPFTILRRAIRVSMLPEFQASELKMIII